MQDIYVHTSDNTYQHYFLKLYQQNQKSSLIIGPPNSGKTALLMHYLSKIPADNFILNVIHLTDSTSANRVQQKIMSKIDRYRQLPIKKKKKKHLF